VPANTLQELVAYAKQNPGKLSYGTNGLGTAPHLAAEEIRMLTGAQMVHVPYKSMQQAMLDATTGQIPLAFALSGMIAPNVAAGKVRAIAVLNERRYPAWPEVATIGESLPGYEPVPSWTGMWAPAGLPQPILRRLSADLVKALNSAEVRTKLALGGTQPVGNTPEEFSAMLKRQTDLVGKIVKLAGIEPME
jgi:tripartite-type tricarboxylate transporter receptor subunit TctC